MNELSIEVKKEMVVTEGNIFALKVIDAGTYKQAGEFVSLRKALKVKIKADLDPICEAANLAHKSATSYRKEQLDKLIPGDNYLNKQMTAWNIEQERLRKEEEDRLRRIAEAKAEEEQLQAAAEAEASGNTEEAEEIINEPIYVAPPVVEKSVPKVDGQAMTITWKWRLKNEAMIPRQYMKIDEVAINAAVRSLKDKTQIPGIEIYPESKMRGVRS